MRQRRRVRVGLGVIAMAGTSRPILPPMPWEVYGRLPDQDLTSIHAYLRRIPAVHNRVPARVIAGD